MKPTTEKFIWEVMDSSKYNVETVKDNDISTWKVLDAEGYEGSPIEIKVSISGGMINITVTNGNKASEQKFLMFEDEERMDIEQSAANLDEMVDALIDTENNPPVDYSEKMSFDDIYAGPQEEVGEENGEEYDDTPYSINCKAYLEDDGEVVLVFDELNGNGEIECWSVNGEHSFCDAYYLDDLEELDITDKRVADAVATYESHYLDNGKLNVLPEDALLGVQERAHKEIYSRD